MVALHPPCACRTFRPSLFRNLGSALRDWTSEYLPSCSTSIIIGGAPKSIKFVQVAAVVFALDNSEQKSTRRKLLDQTHLQEQSQKKFEEHSRSQKRTGLDSSLTLVPCLSPKAGGEVIILGGRSLTDEIVDFRSHHGGLLTVSFCFVSGRIWA